MFVHGSGCSCSKSREIRDWAWGQKQSARSRKARGASEIALETHHWLPRRRNHCNLSCLILLSCFFTCFVWKVQQGGARAGSSSTLASLLKKPFQHLLVCTLFRRVSQTRNNLTGMKGERKRCLDFEQLLATRSFRSIRHFGRVGTGWKRLQSISIHLTCPFHAHVVSLP